MTRSRRAFETPAAAASRGPSGRQHGSASRGQCRGGNRAALAGAGGTAPGDQHVPARARLDGETIVVLKTKTGYRGVERKCPHMQATMMTQHHPLRCFTAWHM